MNLSNNSISRIFTSGNNNASTVVPSGNTSNSNSPSHPGFGAMTDSTGRRRSIQFIKIPPYTLKIMPAPGAARTQISSGRLQAFIQLLPEDLTVRKLVLSHCPNIQDTVEQCIRSTFPNVVAYDLENESSWVESSDDMDIVYNAVFDLTSLDKCLDGLKNTLKDFSSALFPNLIISNEVLHLVADRCPNLKMIILGALNHQWNQHTFDNEGLAYLLSQCQHIENIHLSDLPRITDAIFLQNPNSFQKLEVLSLTKSTQISLKAVAQVATFRLTDICLFDCENLGDIRAVADAFPMLRCLNAMNCPGVIIGSTASLKELYPELKEVYRR